MVYVVDKHGKPLMPTEKHSMVKHFLEDGLAVPICNNPFTIRLKYESKHYTQNLDFGKGKGEIKNGGHGKTSKLNSEGV